MDTYSSLKKTLTGLGDIAETHTPRVVIVDLYNLEDLLKSNVSGGFRGRMDIPRGHGLQVEERASPGHERGYEIMLPQEFGLPPHAPRQVYYGSVEIALPLHVGQDYVNGSPAALHIQERLPVAIRASGAHMSRTKGGLWIPKAYTPHMNVVLSLVKCLYMIESSPYTNESMYTEITRKQRGPAQAPTPSTYLYGSTRKQLVPAQAPTPMMQELKFLQAH